ncbi:MAG: hypothetical protein IJQ02_07930 [Oscillospiraceae bacterium]|nr:hypothetical protein [Oscillospiraceae bacterium]MBR0392828.1 hypothetical protein [Oscillospiraceae bacterium]
MNETDNREVLKRAEDLCRRSERKGQITNSAFLTPAERMLLEKQLHPAPGTCMRFFGGYPDSERSVAFFLPEEYLEEDGFLPDRAEEVICAVSFRAFFGEPGHRDYLGALLASGIERDRLGDILVEGETATVFCLPGILPHLLTIDRIGRVSVKAEAIPLDTVQAPKKEMKRKNLSVMSMRLDAVAAGMFNLSRTSCAKLIAEGMVNLNYSVCLKPDETVREGDVISLRGYGKGRIGALGGNSRKGRQFVEVEVYR